MVRKTDNPNELLRAARVELGLGVAECARALERHAFADPQGRFGNFTCSVDKYKSWEAGAQPRDHNHAVLVSFFKVRSVAELGLGLGPTPANAPSPHPNATAPQPLQEDNVLRRQFLLAASSALAVPATLTQAGPARTTTPPDRASQLAMADALGVPAEHIDRHPWPAWLPDGDPISIDYPWTYSGSAQALVSALQHAGGDRRGLVKVTGPDLEALASQWLTAAPPRLTSATRGSRLTNDLVTQIQEGLHRLRYLEAARGGPGTRNLMHAELGIVGEVITASGHGADTAQRLHGLGAELARVAGWACFDAGLHAAAQRYWIAGLHCAHTADDQPLGANILKSMSLQCHDFGRPGDALTLAQAAYQGARDATPRTRAMLAAREARAHAALGDANACQDRLHDAHTAFDAGTAADDPPWCEYFDTGELYAQTAMCHLDLSQHNAAEVYFSRALQHLGEPKARDRATYLIRHADTRSHLRDYDQAASLLGAAIPLMRQAPSRRNLDRVKAARSRIPDGPHTRALDEQMLTLAA